MFFVYVYTDKDTLFSNKVYFESKKIMKQFNRRAAKYLCTITLMWEFIDYNKEVKPSLLRGKTWKIKCCFFLNTVSTHVGMLVLQERKVSAGQNMFTVSHSQTCHESRLTHPGKLDLWTWNLTAFFHISLHKICH